tara:strand:+ start:5722 stop:5913 length:192 start_codon:yes stop_codon:yes gene_type:complete
MKKNYEPKLLEDRVVNDKNHRTKIGIAAGFLGAGIFFHEPITISLSSLYLITKSIKENPYSER